MATQDEQENTIDFTIVVLGDGAHELLTTVGARYGVTADDIEQEPTVSLALTSGAGPKAVFHLSAFESDHARADAVMIAGRVDPDDIPGGHELVRVDGDVMAALKTASRIAIEKIRGRALPLMPHTVREGLHRHTHAGDPPLLPDGPPRVGRQVKIQLNLRDRLGWLAMGGPITRVVGPDTAEAAVVTTTDNAPEDFAGTWRATLERRSGWQFPWILTSLAPDRER